MDSEHLRAAILEEPTDPTRWAVYADWLEEGGHPAADSTRRFVTLLAQGRPKQSTSWDEREAIWRSERAACVRVNTAALAAGDPEHAAFCQQAALAALRYTVDDFVNEEAHRILDSEECCAAMAETNAEAWSVDELEVLAIRWDEGGCVADCSYSASGEQREERMYCGNRMTGTAVARIDEEGDVSFEEVGATVDPDWFGEGEDDVWPEEDDIGAS